jgi:hypothetical protein
VAGLFVHHDQNADCIANAEKMLKDFTFGKLLVRHRQHHHRIGGGVLRA